MTSNSIDKKTVLVTGAAHGLGSEIALAFLSAGYRVALNFHSSEEAAAELADGSSGNAVAVMADVGSVKEVSAMIKKIEAVFGRLDVVVNNAGIAIDRLLIKQSEEEWDSVIRTNLTGCFNVIRAAAPLMSVSGGGHIINISSYSGAKGSAGQAAYSASKSAIAGLSLTAAKELAEQNIRVNTVIPGYMPTAMGMSSPKAMERAREESALQRLSCPAEVAGFIVAIAALRNVTGQTFSLESRIL